MPCSCTLVVPGPKRGVSCGLQLAAGKWSIDNDKKKEGIPRGTPSVVLSDCCWKVLFDNYCLGKFLLLFGSILGQRNGQDAVFDFCADLVFLDVLGQRQHLFELH